MPELVRGGKVSATPGEQKIALMILCHSQVQRVTPRVRRHDSPNDVGIHDVDDSGRDRQQRQLPDECQTLGSGSVLSGTKLLHDGHTGHQLVQNQSTRWTRGGLAARCGAGRIQVFLSGMGKFAYRRPQGKSYG